MLLLLFFLLKEIAKKIAKIYLIIYFYNKRKWDHFNQILFHLLEVLESERDNFLLLQTMLFSRMQASWLFVVFSFQLNSVLFLNVFPFRKIQFSLK